MPSYAWHFLAAGQDGQPVLRDGRPLVVGEWLTHLGPCIICESGLHASYRALDALRYAPGPFVCLCEVDCVAYEHSDKLVCTMRKPLWCIDATEVLRLFARLCALDVLHPWDVPAVVRQYLVSGDPDPMAASQAAARASAWPNQNDLLESMLLTAGGGLGPDA